MNCTEFNKALISVSEMHSQPVNGNAPGGLAVGQQAEFAAHRVSCAACQASYEAEVALLTALREMPVPAPSADFADRVLRAAIAQKGAQTTGHHQRHGFMWGFGSAAVAALALWVVVGVFPEAISPVGSISDEVLATNDAPASNTGKPELSIVLNQQQDIKLAFYSGESLNGAKITIRLPENVALVGYPGRRQLSWTTNLKKGDNLLRLPVIATQVAKGELIADIEFEGRVKTLMLGVEASAADTSNGKAQFTPLVS